MKHGGWWRITKVLEITGSVAIQFGNRTYVKALDTGLFTLGAPHDEGDGKYSKFMIFIYTNI